MALTDSPSSGQSEVLTTLHWGGRADVFARLAERVGHDWAITEAIATLKSDLSTVLSALQTAGYVTAKDSTGATVDLTSGQPADTVRVRLTDDGKAYSRHPRPRAKRDPYHGH